MSPSLKNEQPFPSVGSLDKLEYNDDGSIDLYFAPELPNGHRPARHGSIPWTHTCRFFGPYLGEMCSSHMERGYPPPVCSDEPKEVERLKLDEIVVKSRVGGLVKSFERKSALTPKL